MGEYIYKITSKTRKIKGLDKPVHLAKFYTKPNFMYPELSRPLVAEKMLEETLIAYDFGDGDQIYRVSPGSNYFSDYGARCDSFELLGTMHADGKRFKFVEEYPVEKFCKQFWKDLSFTDSNHSSDTVVWYKDQFLTSKRDAASAKAFADQYLQRLLEKEYGQAQAS
jgi:hypothetical protein